LFNGCLARSVTAILREFVQDVQLKVTRPFAPALNGGQASPQQGKSGGALKSSRAERIEKSLSDIP
jgi:hypothetical protein